MPIFRKTVTLQNHLHYLKQQKGALGFVPTMGALHVGHLSLIKNATAKCRWVVVSIFVNPTQFNNIEDLEKYPRNVDKDLALLNKLNPELIVFLPGTNEIYRGQARAESFDFDGLEQPMEGKYRQGHFNGVGTVVHKLLSIVAPQYAFFGEKDYQQLMIIKKLVSKKSLDVKIVGCPIYREKNGLAFSSRNERLPAKIRDRAGIIYKTLTDAKQQFKNTSVTKIRQHIIKRFEAEPEFDLEYVEIARADNLRSVVRKSRDVKYRIFLAVCTNSVRLIDNMALN